MKIGVIVQARIGSTRLPGKVLAPIGNTTLIALLLTRLRQSKEVNSIVVAVPDTKENSSLIEYVRSLGVCCESGPDLNVLQRYIKVAEKYNFDVIVRITADCPFIDPTLLDTCIVKYLGGNFDYISNCEGNTFPDGLDVEVISMKALRLSFSLCKSKANLEHVTKYIRESDKFRKDEIKNEVDEGFYRWTVDYPEDLDFVRALYFGVEQNSSVHWKDLIRYLKSNSSILNINKMHNRNDGALISTGEKLWARAKRVIPGGTMLLSKRPDLHLPNRWPTYFSRAKGCNIWDLDDNQYVDVHIMGVGTNVLGYANDEIDGVVFDAVRSGNMSTLNCPEEVLLAEKLVELHPWSSMVRFARTGGEACAIGIRIARAAAGRSGVAACGYHGWHDWYISANISTKDTLAGHLLGGLSTGGVPEQLSGTTHTFRYGQIDELRALIKNKDIGVIIMEVARNSDPDIEFLKDVRELASQNSIVLIFDECTSGFRQNLGGIHLKTGVIPDIALFGKALGNGYPITAIVGTKVVMEYCQTTFISSTFWTDRIGPAAALATINYMERHNTWLEVEEIGKYIKKLWKSTGEDFGLNIETYGLDALPSFRLPECDFYEFKTFVTQEMLKKQFLSSTSVYVSIAHKKNILLSYEESLREVFQKTAKILHEEADLKNYLEVPICTAGFTRLN